jgi:hypothetical protein
MNPDSEDFQEAVVVREPATNNQAIAKLDNFTNMGDVLGYAETLLQSKLLPTSIKTPEAVAAIILSGKELGLGAMAALNNIVVIQQRPTLGVHAIGALLRKAGADSQTLEDFVPVMGLEGDTKDKVVDYRTTIRFFRRSNGRELQEDVSFTWKEATKMELTAKPTWTKMPKIMLWSRCFAIGARRIAPDALLGIYETAEAADFSGQNYRVDEEGKVTVLS